MKKHELLVLAMLALVGALVWRSYVNRPADGPPFTQADPAKRNRIVAAGDIVCELGAPVKRDRCQHERTLQLVKDLKPNAVLALGDLQYPDGTPEEFRNGFARSWGTLGKLLYPTPGNHEYHVAGAPGYFGYFKDKRFQRGYYSFDLAGWHIISLNSNCAETNDCGEGSQQVKWLEQDIKANQQTCTLAFWHHPRFTSGKYHDDQDSKSRSDVFWRKLTAAKAEVVLNGHDHLYERFAPSEGLRQFTSGAGGRSLYAQQADNSNSEKIIDDEFGVLSLDLFAKSYKWEFVSVTGRVLDAGTGQCR